MLLLVEGALPPNKSARSPYNPPPLVLLVVVELVATGCVRTSRESNSAVGSLLIVC